MRNITALFLCLGLSSPFPTQEGKAGKEKEEGFVSLFDGRTLSGWKGRPELWKVKDGVIVGSTKPNGITFNTFLIGEKEYSNFILKLEFKFMGGNSGVQFRSRPTGDPQRLAVSGYQADIGERYFGALYDEARRNRLLKSPDNPTVAKAYKKDDWNEYEIRAMGENLHLLLNGIPTVTYQESEKDIPRKGIIALQLHGGPPMEVHFKNIRIKSLDG